MTTRGRTVWIALFRGLNVGGNNRIKMDALKSTMTAVGCTDVATYIQSGNAVFRGASARAALCKNIEQALADDCDINTSVCLLKATELQSAVENNPFPEAAAEPKTLQVFFLSKAPTAAIQSKLEALRGESETFVVTQRTLFLHAPDGIGRSKLVAYAARMPGVDVTARNWRTVCKLQEMAHNL